MRAAPLGPWRAFARAVRMELALGVIARLARAHDDAPADVVPVLDPLPDRLADVTVQLKGTLAHQLVIENLTRRVLEVLDEEGIPFLRLGPTGAEADLARTAWYRTATAGAAAIPAAVREGRSSGAWVRVSTRPAWGWYDRRLCRAVGAARFTIPLRLDGTPVALHGRFRPVGGAFRSRLTSSSEPLRGVHVSLVGGRVPALYLENAGEQPVDVLGAAGEPFLRIGPDGTSANLRSPTWRRSAKAPTASDTPIADTSAPPAWQLQSPSSRYAWIEFRAAYAEEGTRAPSRRRTVVGRWAVPLRRGLERAVVSGVVEWVPVTDGVKSGT